MREFLKGLDLDKEVIETIMAEYGKNISSFKEQINDYKKQITDYEGQVKDYQGQVKDLNTKIEENAESLKNLETLTNENRDLKADLQLKGTNVKKEFSKFVRSEVMSQVDDKTDFTKALESYKKENPQFFGDVVVKKVQTSPSLNGGTPPQTTNDIMNSLIRGETN